MYGVEVSPTLISNITDAVIDEVKQWQNRHLNSDLPTGYLIELEDIEKRLEKLSHTITPSEIVFLFLVGASPRVALTKNLRIAIYLRLNSFGFVRNYVGTNFDLGRSRDYQKL
ncbi:MAG: transposase [Pseudanabaena sp.]